MPGNSPRVANAASAACQDQTSAALVPIAGTLTVAGYGIRFTTERGHMIVEEGTATCRARGRFARVGHGIRRVFVIGHTGSVSLDALRWLSEVGVPFANLGIDHRIVTMSPVRILSDVRVRRGQALAGAHAVGLDVTRRLLVAKLRGQRRVLERLPQSPEAIDEVEAARDTLEQAESLEAMRYLEAKAAMAYWKAWERMPMQFAARDQKQIPAHWRHVGARQSAIRTSGPRYAAAPVNAIRNYLYAILEAETRLACWGAGLDPELGILHFDRRMRSSFACDLMEPVRPIVDEYVFDLLQSRTFSRDDFFEQRDGHCRVMPQLAKPLSGSALRWMRAVAPFAEDVADAFLRLGRETAPRRTDGPSRLHPVAALPSRTPLTKRKMQRATRAKAEPVMGHQESRVLYRCRTCGVDTGALRREYCASCRGDRYVDAERKAHQVLSVRRSEGRDLRSTDASRKLHAEQARDLWRRQHAWEDAHGGKPSKEEFRRRFGRLLANVRPVDLARATGLTGVAGSLIKRGKLIPHPMHWDAIRRVLGTE